MEWSFRSGDQERACTILETLVAIKPQPALFEFISNSTAAVLQPAGLESDAEVLLSAPYREIFERQGWIFAKPTSAIAKAATTRSHLPGLEAVAQVAINEFGDPMLTTDLITLQMPENFSKEKVRAQLAEDQLTLVLPLGFAPNLFQVRVPPGRPLSEIVEALEAKSDTYLFVEPDVLEIIRERSSPPASGLQNQWQHSRIDSAGAWNFTKGRGVRLAVIDHEFDVNHPGLKPIVGGGAIRASTALQPFVKLSDAFPFPNTPHGTFCLGMAGAKGTDPSAVRGSAPEVDLLAITCLEDILGSQTTLARAVGYAADPRTEEETALPSEGADIISCSLGVGTGAGWIPSENLKMALTQAATKGSGDEKGTTIFWAASDFEIDIEKDGVCSNPNVIAVGRSNKKDDRGNGAVGKHLAFLAPGDNVFSTVPGGKFGFNSGTSFAAPLAAGVAALVLSQDKTLTVEELRRRLIDSCDKIGGKENYDDNGKGRNDKFGFGRINAAKAIKGD